jgi:VanZ family protein
MNVRLTKQSAWRYGPAAAMSLVIPLLSLAPAWLFRSVEKSLPPIPGFDKIVHAAMYAALTAACLHALPQDKRLRLRTLLTVVLCVSLYGATMELCQYWLTHTRARDSGDALANAAGAFLCSLASYLWARWLARRTRS